MKELHSHKVNPANDALEVRALDEPGQGGACHLYEISGYSSATNPSDPFTKRYGAPADHSTILFQNGPIATAGVNGITHEALLAILIDRLEGFQAGAYACADNAVALDALKKAQEMLQARTKARMARNVEGTHTV